MVQEDANSCDAVCENAGEQAESCSLTIVDYANEKVLRNADGSLRVASSVDAANYVALRTLDREQGVGLYTQEVQAGSDVIIALLITDGGRVASVADKINVSAPALRRYIDERPSIAEIVETFDDLRVEAAERVIDKEIKHADSSATRIAAAKFLLQTKGKDRGYTQRMEVSNKSVNITVNRSIYEGSTGSVIDAEWSGGNKY